MVSLSGKLILGALFVWIGISRKQWMSSMRAYTAAVVSVLGVYLIFSPFCWDQYSLFYLPFWILLWGNCAGRGEKLLLLGGAALNWLPLAVIRGGSFSLFEPIQSHMLWGQVLIIAAAVIQFGRMVTGRPEKMIQA